METREYDVVVIGGGPVGENAAQYAVEGVEVDGRAMTAAIVEHELLGGECSYWACMPSKALLRPVAVAATTADLPGVSTAHVAAKALLERRDDWVSHYDDSGQVSWAEGAGLAVVRGSGRLAGERTVAVATPSGDEVLLTARQAVVIATGSEPVVPEMYADALPWGSRDATGVVEVPDRLVIVGGGVVACEAAVWMSALGSSVTLLARSRLLGRSEPFAGEAVLEGLRERGVTVHIGCEVTGVHRVDPAATGIGKVHGGAVTVSTTRGEIEADELLLAIGRSPRLESLGLETVGLTPDDVTEGRLPEWLSAVGDASGGPPLTHWGKHQARVAGARIAARATGEVAWEPDREAPVPQVVFSEPEVASVGLTEAEARSAGHDVVVSRVPTSAAAGTGLLRDHVAGQSQIVVDAQTRLLLGATFVGPEVAELVHAATVAIVGGVPVHVLRHAVASYPTASELWLRMLEDLPREFRRP
ncbi:dihydrolipoamide dehydrogenase [Nocardioides sp. BE266]|uniref:dihydrolipoyl dehydrogenase family protein n=1 Tax=Nocardioides sp. BE266 TaxID=2817725 RepID=UPI0028643C5D|nr:NAD(P)/FAD-dependent oxidoreductase [Nocardioides sp. BE266]MDR7252957.1 dihydrolipoamide dehydrogenase [Nocardioides sp. BE266]